jgi:glycosyltransferase involved in cell wall biosynthesis
MISARAAEITKEQVNESVTEMRVLMVTPSFYPIEGGTETMVRNLSIELKKVGVHADILTFNMDRKWDPKWRKKIEKIEGVTVFRVPALNWLPIKHSPRITSKINLIPGRFTHLMKEYDIIHFHEAEFSFPFFSYFVKKPKILHLHGIRLDYFKRYHFSRFLLKTAADLYLSLTEQMKNELIALGIPKDKIELLPNAVDPQIFQAKGKKMDNKLLYVGRIDPGKGLQILLKSLKYVNNSVHLEIIGPPGWSSDYYQNVLRLIEIENRRGIHKIRYLGRVNPNQASLIESYQNASILVLSSFYEAFGVVILEAMACKTPVISTPTGGTKELIKHGENGLLVSINNPIELAAGINYLLEKKDVRIKFGNAGRKLVIEKFSFDVVIKKLCKIYEKFVNN